MFPRRTQDGATRATTVSGGPSSAKAAAGQLVLISGRNVNRPSVAIPSARKQKTGEKRMMGVSRWLQSRVPAPAWGPTANGGSYFAF